jgi:hypothetical protein
MVEYANGGKSVGDSTAVDAAPFVASMISILLQYLDGSPPCSEAR